MKKSKLIKQHNIFFNCLSNNHVLDKRQSKINCKVDDYTKHYDTLLHRSRVTQSAKTSSLVDQNNNKGQNFNISKVSLLKIIPVILFSGNNEIKTNAHLDLGLIASKI